MARKNNLIRPHLRLTPEATYIYRNGRSLPILHCYINGNWQIGGFATILVVRQHPEGDYLVGSYLVDILCLGIKDALTLFKLTQPELEDIFKDMQQPTEISYNEVHNIIYGAINFALKGAEVQPHSGFDLAEYLLEAEDADIPHIKYKFGRFGKPYLAVETRAEAIKYLPLLQRKYGPLIPYFVKEEEHFDIFGDLFDTGNNDLSNNDHESN